MRTRKWRRSFSWYFIWTFFFLIAFLSLLAVVVNLPIWQIKSVEIGGTQILSSQELETIAAIPLNENLWLANFSRTIRNLEKIMAIKSFKIFRIPPATVRISIKERKPIAVMIFADESAIIDEEGYILNSNRSLSLNISNFIDLPAVSGLSKEAVVKEYRISPPVSEIISEIISKLTQFYEPKKLHIEYRSQEDLSFLLDDLLRIRLGRGEDISKKMLVFKRLFLEIQGKPNMVEYLDLRFPQNPVIKYRS